MFLSDYCTRYASLYGTASPVSLRRGGRLCPPCVPPYSAKCCHSEPVLTLAWESVLRHRGSTAVGRPASFTPWWMGFHSTFINSAAMDMGRYVSMNRGNVSVYSIFFQPGA